MWDSVQVKEEAVWEGDGVSAEAACAGLYAGHEVKRELAVGPEVLQPPDFAFRFRPNFEVTVVKEELNDEESGATGSNNGGSNQIDESLKEKCQFSLYEPLVLKPCTVQLERILQEKKQLSDNTARIQHKLLGPKLIENGGNRDIAGSEGYKTRVHRLEGSFVCDHCGLLFTLRKKIVFHLRAFTCMKKAPKARFKKITKPLCCKTNQQFNERANLMKNDQIFSGEKLHKCDVCEKRFYQSSHLYRHKRTHGPKPVKQTYPCEICDKLYTSSYGLVAHLRIHTGQMPYICQCCGKQYNKKSILINHERIHTENKQYSCEVCNGQFATKWNLTKHKRSHENEYPYPCDLCAKKYMHSYSLTKHKRKKHR